MKTFEEYQAAAIRTPVCPDAKDFNLSVLALQEESGKIGRLLSVASASGKLEPTDELTAELRYCFGDMLWYIATLCEQVGVSMQEIAQESLIELEKRSKMDE